MCIDFNPRLREGGDKIDILFPPNKRYFNPRLREGGDVYDSSGQIVKYISIHASAKEATMDRLSLLVRAKISIHASAKEATKKRVTGLYIV